MGQDKARLEIGGMPVLVRTGRLLESLVGAITVVGTPERYAGLGLRVIPDDQPGLGPLGGIATALRVTASDWNLIVGCDLPYLSAAWLEYLVARAVRSAADAVLPESIDQGVERLEPVCAMYHRRSRPAIAAALAGGIRKVSDGLADLAMEVVTSAEWKAFDSGNWLFKNMNTPADYQEARAMLEESRAE